jgi:hypothetical protein
VRPARRERVERRDLKFTFMTAGLRCRLHERFQIAAADARAVEVECGELRCTGDEFRRRRNGFAAKGEFATQPNTGSMCCSRGPAGSGSGARTASEQSPLLLRTEAVARQAERTAVARRLFPSGQGCRAITEGEVFLMN